ncbi:MAG: hypothetical protein K8H86_04635, partial [Ignavibacteriaceae bacterium]|nr:hypothetical protein [Ignavibacteriaceae bacterium]
ELINFSLQLGSDVPFFINPLPSFAESRGEVLKSFEIKINKPVLIINPGIHISTSWAFGNITPRQPENSLTKISAKDFETISSLKNIITNDFEKIVFEKYTEIASIKNQLYKYGAEFAIMTGTGSTVFGIFNTLDDAKYASDTFNKKYFRFIHYEI